MSFDLYIMDWNARNKATQTNIIEEKLHPFVGIVQNSSLDYTKYSFCNADVVAIPFLKII